MQIYTNGVLLDILEKPQSFSEGLYIQIQSAQQLLQIYQEVAQGNAQHQVYRLEANNYKKIVKEFKKHFQIVKAAGGVVSNADKVLFIFRHERWDLPKGKIDEGENKKQAAVREIAEECGIEVKLKGKITHTWHTYTAQGKAVLKKTYWYEMHPVGSTVLTPQTEESITEARWVKIGHTDKLLANSYPTIRYVFQQFLVKKVKYLFKELNALEQDVIMSVY